MSLLEKDGLRYICTDSKGRPLPSDAGLRNRERTRWPVVNGRSRLSSTDRRAEEGRSLPGLDALVSDDILVYWRIVTCGLTRCSGRLTSVRCLLMQKCCSSQRTFRLAYSKDPRRFLHLWHIIHDPEWRLRHNLKPCTLFNRPCR